MLQLSDDKARNVIPRWRSFAAAVQFREVEAVSPQTAPSPPSISDGQLSAAIQQGIADWRSSNSVTVACDVLSAAVGIEQHASLSDVARFILENPSAGQLASGIAQRCLDGTISDASPEFFEAYGRVEMDRLRWLLHSTRSRLRTFPENPILWANLALMHTIEGNIKKAMRAIAVAMALAPGDRFVTRGAARLFHHIDETDRAHSVLLRADSLRTDPWLLASELAFSELVGRTSPNMKRARQLLDRAMLSPFHLSELAVAFATYETRNGAMKNARKLYKSSLVDPAENAIAQASWLQRKHHLAPEFPVERQFVSHEALAWTARLDGNWGRARENAMRWADDQPFSKAPFLLASSVVSVFQKEYLDAESILRRALRANGRDVSLLNNLAYALAKQGKVNEAERALSIAHEGDPDKRQTICLTATKGLTFYRTGDVERGREFYVKAIKMAVREKAVSLAVFAKFHFAIEELNHSSAEAMAPVIKELQTELPAVFLKPEADTLLALLDDAQHTAPRTQ